MGRLLLGALLLSLAANSSQEKLELKSISPPPMRGSAASLRLQCVPSNKELADHGVYWFRQLATMKAPQFFLHFHVKPKWANGFGENKFKVNKDFSSFTLEIKNFGEEDQGDYYCLISNNMVLLFSNRAPLYYPQVTTPAPKIISIHNDAGRTSDNCTCPTAPTPDKTQKKESLDFSCSLYILVPLGAVALIFLIAFLVTINCLCKFLIRRKRCKHHNAKRLIIENNARPNVPNRYV
ncbi:T-cell surface glycoprotein CD8 alpha chain [Lissotriton helveticus]